MHFVLYKFCIGQDLVLYLDFCFEDCKNWAFHVGATFLMKVYEDKVLGVITFIWTHMTFELNSNLSQNTFTESVHVDLINISHPIRSIDCHNSFVLCVSLSVLYRSQTNGSCLGCSVPRKRGQPDSFLSFFDLFQQAPISPQTSYSP